MSARKKFYLKEIVLIVVLWGVLNYVHFFTAFYGQSLEYKSEAFRNYVDSGSAHIDLLFDSLLYGSWFAGVHLLFEWTRLRRLPFAITLLLKTLAYYSGLLGVWTIDFLFTTTQEYRELRDIVSPRLLLGILIWITFASIVINLTLELRRKVGPRTFLSWVNGRYHEPHEQQRLFLFFDMVGSTTIAESLGHKSYSQLVQRCFGELTDLLVAHKGEVYQYLGDGVLLTWSLPPEESVADCVSLVREFRRRISRSQASFREQFGTVPLFRAGADLGSVMATEVGTISRTIAYHGDVLNTAARVQGLCKELDADFLVSERVRHFLTSDVNSESRGELVLRGKKETVQVYALLGIGS